jgi:hypothetical protein
MDDHDGPRRLSKPDAKDIAHAHLEPVDPSGGDTPRSSETLTPVEHQDPELLVVEYCELRSGPCHDGGRVKQPRQGFERCGGNTPTPQLDGGCNPERLGGTDATVLSELADAGAEQPADTTLFVEQNRGQESAGWSFSSQYDGKEIGVAQRFNPAMIRSLDCRRLVSALEGRNVVSERVVSGHGPPATGAMAQPR